MNSARQILHRWREITDAAQSREAAVQAILREFANAETPTVSASICDSLESVVRDTHFVREKRPLL